MAWSGSTQSMDTRRSPRARPRRVAIIVIALAASSGAIAIAMMPRAAPSIADERPVIDSVRREPLVLDVRGAGTLVSLHQQWVTAATAGRVEQRPVESGAAVDVGTVLYVMSNPEVLLESFVAERELRAAELEFAGLRRNLESEQLSQRGVLATLGAEIRSARRNVATSDTLARQGMLARETALQAHDRLEELETRVGVEEQRLALLAQRGDSLLGMQAAQLAQLRDIKAFHQRRVDGMAIRATTAGVVQDVVLEIGQWAQAGAVLARIVDPERLKAVLQIPEAQTRDLATGQPAMIDARVARLRGRVSRVAASARDAAVAVEVAIEDSLPRGVRPDQTVSGTIQLARIAEALVIDRPAFARPNAVGTMFRITDDGRQAERVRVRFGRASVDRIEILDGLAVGDRVIISDLPDHQEATRVRLR